MKEIIEKIAKTGVVPVVEIEELSDALNLAKALSEGGIKTIEITLRTKVAIDAIKLIKNEYPDILLGAGTVINTNQIDQAIEAGAEFIVSPGLNEKNIKYAKEKNILIIPGCSSASDIEKGIENGLEVVKFFPAELIGGLSLIKALSAPYSNILFMPTGGIDLEKASKYLEFEKIIACGGSFMVKKELIKSGNFKEIKRLTEETVSMVRRIRI